MSTHYIYRMDICKNDLYHGAYIGQHKIGSKDPSCDGYNLSNRLRRKYHMPHPTQEAKKYLIKEM